ncbi:MAG TPA: 4-(cytidine 5'-diphospho)-2-C-methyl-D-erythritol kinase [Phycisphaerae bacterium]|nr:4-(cytidine 5'-diphospho)-2-C-methyl-D-erythritol kinase [Phycisphaerae bacterium]
MLSIGSGGTVNQTMPERSMECLAPAKVNMTLAVLGKRSDGYHELESWVVMARLFDRLVFTERTGLSLAIRGDSNGVPADESNLAWRAAAALAKAIGRQPAVAITLWKQIPVGGGLGGGSSDAAATLIGLNNLWGSRWPVERLKPIAAGLGSDVPLFLQPGSAIIRGRGEEAERLAEGWRGWLALVVPPYPVSTAEVYRRWSEAPARSGVERRPWRDRTAGSGDLASRLFNDLEPGAFAVEPRLKALHDRLNGLDGRPVRMTGSGSCLFAIFDKEAEAKAWSRLASEQLEDGAQMRVVETM